MYTLGAFLGLLAVYFALRGFRPGCQGGLTTQRRLLCYWVAYTLAATAGLYSLYYFAFLLIPLNLLIGYSLFWPKWRRAIPTIWPWVLANLAIIALYLPWLPIAWKQATNPPVPPWRSTQSLWVILTESWTALSLGESVLGAQIWPILLLVLGLFGWGLITMPDNGRRVLLPLLTFGPLAIIYLAPRIGLTDGSLYHGRYIFTYASPFYLVLGVALAGLWRSHHRLTLLLTLILAGGAGFSLWEFHTNPRYTSDDLRSAVKLIQQKWRPGDVMLINAGYAYTGLQYYYPDPAIHYQRLTSPIPDHLAPPATTPLALETGTINGPSTLGWADPAADFYAMPQPEALAALETVTQTYPRLWLIRIYDTVTDPQAIIRQWLAENMTLFEDQVFSGPANMRVQGYLSRHQPPPPVTANLTLGNQLLLRGFTPPPTTVSPGSPIDVALWWEAQRTDQATPYALSLKLWDGQGNLAAQTEPDEWPVGNRYFTPDWRPGQIIRYPMRLHLPADTPPGQYWLNIVIYNPQTGAPLTVQETGEAVVLLGSVTVAGQ